MEFLGLEVGSPPLQDSDHECVRSLCKFDECRECDCADAKETPHCRHCYHCLGFTSVIFRGCRACPFSPDRDKYKSWLIETLRGYDPEDTSILRDCTKIYSGYCPPREIDYLEPHPAEWTEETEVAGNETGDICDEEAPSHDLESKNPPGVSLKRKKHDADNAIENSDCKRHQESKADDSEHGPYVGRRSQTMCILPPPPFTFPWELHTHMLGEHPDLRKAPNAQSESHTPPGTPPKSSFA